MACCVGVIGAGVVGGGVIETLLTHRKVITDKGNVEVELKHVAEINQTLLEEFNLEGVTTSDSAETLIADPEVEIVCELIGGLEPAKTLVLAALNAGKHVVTANKMLIATAGPELTEAAIRNNVELRYEAAVAGAIPIIKSLREGLVANEIKAVYAILNGTCNYILTRMTYEDLEFNDVLQQAIGKGFAEKPPDLDIEGHDTAHKCQILASLCYSTKVDLDALHIEGITKVSHLDVKYARESGYLIKLLAVVRRVGDEIEARIHPTLVPESHLLAAVNYEFNAIYIESDVADVTMYYGRGAGKFPTASAVVQDVAGIAQSKGTNPIPPFHYPNELPLHDMAHHCGQYYLRLTTDDHPGVLGSICTLLGDHGVSIASCRQKEESDSGPAHITIMTHETVESDIKGALEKIDALECVPEETHVIRVL